MTTMNLIFSELLKTPINKVLPKKRYASAPDINYLKEQQMEGFERLKYFLNDKDYNMFCLEGFAGTGKTTLISIFVEWLLTTKRTVQIAMTAPTNKAVRQLYKSAEYTHTNLTYATIYSLCGMKEKINDFGEQVFEKEYGVPSKIEDMQYLIVDEVSMLQDDIFELIEPYTHKNLKIIFIGDPAQTPPIGKKDCIPFDAAQRREYGIDHFRMTKILRQAEGNPIIKTTMIIRENLNERDPLKGSRKSQIDENGRGVLFLNNGDVLYDIMETYYQSENYKYDPDFIKVICYTNKWVAYMNLVVRELIYGETEPQKIKLGEKLIANKPILWGDEIIFTANEEMEVLSFTVEEEDINEGQHVLKFYKAVVTKTHIDNTVTHETIRIIHEDSEKLYNKILKQLRQLAESQVRGSVTSKRYWTTYWEFIRYFADIIYTYAITTHKSQGSTYNIAIVMEDNLNTNYNKLERNKLKYTATSRAKDFLGIVSKEKW